MQNFDDVLLELSYRVGIVDLTKEYQVTELINILKEEGYQSFPEIFAEDYDSMPCNLNKITTVGEQMNILCYDSTKIETIKTPEIQEKLRFNQQHFWNKDHSQQIHDLLESAWDQ